MFLLPLLLAADPPARKIDFAQDVRSIFVRHCVSCHGPDKQKGGLRLDDKAAALKGGDGGPVIVPGKAADSVLFRLASASRGRYSSYAASSLAATGALDIDAATAAARMFAPILPMMGSV